MCLLNHLHNGTLTLFTIVIEKTFVEFLNAFTAEVSIPTPCNFEIEYSQNLTTHPSKRTYVFEPISTFDTFDLALTANVTENIHVWLTKFHLWISVPVSGFFRTYCTFRFCVPKRTSLGGYTVMFCLLYRFRTLIYTGWSNYNLPYYLMLSIRLVKTWLL